MADTLLDQRDYTVIVAKTATDPVTPPPGFVERWEQAQHSLLDLLKTCESLDPDGITVYVACETDDQNCDFKWHEHVTSDQLEPLLRETLPPRLINLDRVLQSTLDDYFARKQQHRTKPNGEIILVVLDGEPSDRMAIAKTIVQATQKMERNEELGIGLVQIGDDPIAQGFFETLDHHLQEAGARFDIVTTQTLDTIPPDALTQFLKQTLLG